MTTSRRKATDRRLRKIELREPEYLEDTDIGAVRDFLSTYFPSVEVLVKPPVIRQDRKTDIDAVAESLARCRVKNPSDAVQSFEPMFGEIDYERRAAVGQAKVGGIVYDGRKYSNLLYSVLAGELRIDCASIAFTQRLLSTFSRDDLRHHLRTVVCGFPSVVSIPGIVEAPAKPKEYYLSRQRLEAIGAGQLQLEELKSSFRGRFVDYGDPRMVDVVKGLALQAVMFHLTLKPFCDHAECRLFNAHWQEDLVKSQISSTGLCKEHQEILVRLRDNPIISW